MTIKEKKNMKRIYTVGLCLMAVSALGAVAASSASAGELLARVAGGGSVAGTTFLAQAALPLVWTHSGNVIHCAFATSHGLFLSAVLGAILIRYSGCTVNGLVCNTNGAGAGEIHLPLSTLFVLGLAHLTLSTGQLPAALILSNLVVIKCGMISVELKGNAIGALQRNGAPVPLNTPFLDVNLNFQQTANGLQHLRLLLLPGTIGPSSFDLELRAGLFGRQELASEVANALVDLFRLNNGTHIDIELVEP
jgi:hypothetical protein